jgi:hypothetical protein
MANFSWIFKLLNYVPTVLEVVKMTRGGGGDADEGARLTKAESSLVNLRKDTDKRLDDLREEVKELRGVQRQLRSVISVIQVIMWSSLIVGAIGFVLAIVALIVATR